MHVTLFDMSPSCATMHFWPCPTSASLSFLKRSISVAHPSMSALYAGPHHPGWTCESVASPSSGQSCCNQMVPHLGCEGDTEAIEILSVAQSLLFYVAMHCHEAIWHLWTTVIICDELWVSLGLASKHNGLHCLDFHHLPWMRYQTRSLHVPNEY